MTMTRRRRRRRRRRLRTVRTVINQIVGRESRRREI